MVKVIVSLRRITTGGIHESVDVMSFLDAVSYVATTLPLIGTSGRFFETLSITIAPIE